jgi:hypothetical protein
MKRKFSGPLGDEEPNAGTEPTPEPTNEPADDPAALKAELVRIRAALKTSNDQAAKLRLESKAKADADKSLAEQLAEERTARLADREAAKVKGAIVALKEADAIGDKAALGALVKLLASTEEDAVDAAVASLKAQFPTLFKAKAGTRIPASGRGNANPGKPPEDPTEWSPATKKMLGIK